MRKFGSLFSSVVLFFAIFLPGYLPTKVFFTYCLQVPYIASILLLLAVWFILKVLIFCPHGRRSVVGSFFLYFGIYVLFRDFVLFLLGDTGDMSYFLRAIVRAFAFLFFVALLEWLYNHSALDCNKAFFYFTVLIAHLFLFFAGSLPSFRYVLQVKVPLLLLFLVLFGEACSKGHLYFYLYPCFQLFRFSFLGKRCGVFNAFFALVCLSVFFYRNLKGVTRFCTLAVLPLASVYFVISWRYCNGGSFVTMVSNYNQLSTNRVGMQCRAVEKYRSFDLSQKIFGVGDVYEIVDYPHSVYLSLLLSYGLVGLLLFFLGFFYVAIQFLRFKGKNFADAIAWYLITVYGLNMHFTGFYLYYLGVIFVLYFLHFRYGNGKLSNFPPLAG